MNRHLQVAIVGAGIGGLTLARALKRKEKDFILLEKSKDTPRHSYGITLQSETSQSLAAVVETDEAHLRTRLAVDRSRGHVGALCPAEKPFAVGFRANRSRLEGMLKEGLSEVSWEHEVTQVHFTDIGQIQLRIRDKPSISASIVVASDGVHSILRKLLLPSHDPVVLPYVVFNGKRIVDGSKFDHLYSKHVKDLNVLKYRVQDVLLQISVNDLLDNGSVSFSYTFSRRARKNDTLHRPDRLNADASKIPPELFVELEQLGDLPEPFDDMFRPNLVATDRVLHWLMRSSLASLQDLNRVADKGLAFIGDAVHALPILGGEGANEAISDAVALSEVLCFNPAPDLSQFYDQRYRTWGLRIEESESALFKMHMRPKAPLAPSKSSNL